jgi:hypothetical protein
VSESGGNCAYLQHDTPVDTVLDDSVPAACDFISQQFVIVAIGEAFPSPSL